MSATPVEQMGLQRAIQKALEKERLERNLGQEPGPDILYIAQMVIHGKLKMYKDKNLQAFLRFVEIYQKSFPKIPIYFFTYTEVDNCDHTAQTV